MQSETGNIRKTFTATAFAGNPLLAEQLTVYQPLELKIAMRNLIVQTLEQMYLRRRPGSIAAVNPYEMFV